MLVPTAADPDAARSNSRCALLLHSCHALLLCLLVTLTWLPRFTGPIDLRFDAGVYFLLGTSLVEGHGYRLRNEPGRIEAIQYPPLLPCLVAAVERLVYSRDALVVGKYLKVVYFAFSMAYAVGSYALGCRWLQPRWSLLAATMCALHMHTFFHSNLLFSELPFALLTVAFLLAHLWLRGAWRWLVEVPLLWAGFLLRTAAVALLLAWIAEALIERRWKTLAARILLAAVPVVAWQSYVARVQSSAEYRNPGYEYQRAGYQYYNVSYAENMLLRDPFQPELGRMQNSDLVERIVDNLRALPVSLADGIAAPRGYWERTDKYPSGWKRWFHVPPKPARILMRSFLALAAIGLLNLAWRGQKLPVLYYLGTLAMLCLTPWPGQFARYLMTVTFLSTIFFAVGAAALSGWVARLRVSVLRRGLALVVAVFALLPLNFECYAAGVIFREQLTTAYNYDADGDEIHARLFYHDRYWRAFDQAVEWLRRNAVAEGVIATSSPHYVHLKTGQSAIFPPFEPDPLRAHELLAKVPVDYVIIDSLIFVDIARRYAEPAMQVLRDDGRPAWEEVYCDAAHKTRIYRRRS